MASMDDITAALQNLTLTDVTPLDQELGRGAYGKVFTVKYRGKIYAAKEIHSLLLDVANPEEKRKMKNTFLRECYHCSLLNHPNVVRFIGVYYSERNSLFPVMMMELMGESLTHYVKKPNINMKMKASILYDVAFGLNYLHSYNPPVIHRDLSPNNVLMSRDSVAKISDLGVAKVVRADSRATQTMFTKAPGTVDFMPPESFGEVPAYDTSLDIFSYAGIVLHVVNQEWPSPASQVNQDPVTGKLTVLSEVERRQVHLDKMKGGAEVLKPLVKDCLHNVPSKRPTIVAVFKLLEPLKESPPLVPALQSGCYELTWEKCADLPSPLYDASVVLHKENIFVMAGDTPQRETYDYVFSYNIHIDEWSRLPPPGHYMGILQIINDRLTVIGGVDNVTNKATNKVSTFDNNTKTWTRYYPDLMKPRTKPGVVTHEDHVIVLGGGIDNICRDDIEVLNWTQPLHWMKTKIKLPMLMWNPSLTISHDQLYIVGYYLPNGNVVSAAYQLTIDSIISSIGKPPTKGQSNNWSRLPDAPHYDTALLPQSHPPVIIGGGDIQCSSTSDIAILDITKNKWNRVASLSTPRDCVAVVPISHDSILIIGGSTGGKDIAGAKARCGSTVEKGTISVSHTVVTTPTQDLHNAYTCTIQ